MVRIEVINFLVLNGLAHEMCALNIQKYTSPGGVEHPICSHYFWWNPGYEIFNYFIDYQHSNMTSSVM
jgi:hypothetical protein